jgi:hypothetical protein
MSRASSVVRATRLAADVSRECDRLGLNFTDAAAVSGVSVVIISRLVGQGRAPTREPTLRRLERFVKYARDATQRTDLRLGGA